MRKKIVIGLLLSATLTGMTNSSIFANGPAHKGWYEDGSAGKMYFNEDGSMATGITKVGNYYYLFLPHGGGPNAYLTSGWYNDPITKNRYLFNGRDGAAYTGWYQDGPKGRMYFHKDGTMAKGLAKTDNGLCLFLPDKKGILDDIIHPKIVDTYYQATGWFTDKASGNRYYFNPFYGGYAQKGWYQDGRNGRMYFNEDGVMARGVTKIGDDYYLFTPHGPASDYAGYYQATGWYTDPKTGKRYYFDPNNDGKAIRGITTEVDGKLHTFTYDGSIY